MAALPFVLWHASQVSGLLLGLSLASVALFLLPIIICEYTLWDDFGFVLTCNFVPFNLLLVVFISISDEACGPPPAASEGFGTSLYGSH